MVIPIKYNYCYFKQISHIQSELCFGFLNLIINNTMPADRYKLVFFFSVHYDDDKLQLRPSSIHFIASHVTHTHTNTARDSSHTNRVALLIEIRERHRPPEYKPVYFFLRVCVCVLCLFTYM